jgi:hypothetical protein
MPFAGKANLAKLKKGLKVGKRTYSKMECGYGCGALVSTSGQARVSHYRKHVRDGFLTEHRAYDHSVYFRRTGKPMPAHAESCNCAVCKVKRKRAADKNLDSPYKYALILYFGSEHERERAVDTILAGEFDVFRLNGSLDWNSGESSVLNIETTRRVNGHVYCPLTGEYVEVT